jgi:hypothetical protein
MSGSTIHSDDAADTDLQEVGQPGLLDVETRVGEQRGQREVKDRAPGIGADVEGMLTPSCMFCMDNH